MVQDGTKRDEGTRNPVQDGTIWSQLVRDRTYFNGLENRPAFTGSGGSNPSLSPTSEKHRSGLQDEQDYAQEMQEAPQQNEYMKDRVGVLLLPANHIKDCADCI